MAPVSANKAPMVHNIRMRTRFPRSRAKKPLVVKIPPPMTLLIRTQMAVKPLTWRERLDGGAPDKEEFWIRNVDSKKASARDDLHHQLNGQNSRHITMPISPHPKGFITKSITALSKQGICLPTNLHRTMPDCRIFPAQSIECAFAHLAAERLS